VSFHYSDKKKKNLTETNFQRLAATEPLQFYITPTVSNSFYHAGELVVQLSTINLMKTDPQDTRSAEELINELRTDIQQVSRDITKLFGELMWLLGESVVDPVSTEKLPDGPKLSEFSLPYFFLDENDTPPKSKTGPQASERPRVERFEGP
jgi:hypothetical protein